jgi:hypothetical protein
MSYALGWLAGFLYSQWLSFTVIAPEVGRVAFRKAQMLEAPPDQEEQALVSGVTLLKHANKLGQADNTALSRWKFTVALGIAASFLRKAGWSQKRIEQKVELEIDFGEEAPL